MNYAFTVFLFSLFLFIYLFIFAYFLICKHDIHTWYDDIVTWTNVNKHFYNQKFDWK